MKKAIGMLILAAAALTWNTADAQNNGKGKGQGNKNLQDTRKDEQVVVQPPAQLPPQNTPVILTPEQEPAKDKDKYKEEKDGRFSSKEEQRRHAEERSGGRAFSGKGNDGEKTKTKTKQADPGGGFTVTKYKENKKSKKTKTEKDPYLKKPKKRK